MIVSGQRCVIDVKSIRVVTVRDKADREIVKGYNVVGTIDFARGEKDITLYRFNEHQEQEAIKKMKEITADYTWEE